MKDWGFPSFTSSLSSVKNSSRVGIFLELPSVFSVTDLITSSGSSSISSSSSSSSSSWFAVSSYKMINPLYFLHFASVKTLHAFV